MSTTRTDHKDRLFGAKKYFALYNGDDCCGN